MLSFKKNVCMHIHSGKRGFKGASLFDSEVTVLRLPSKGLNPLTISKCRMSDVEAWKRREEKSAFA
jgi:hypothetical protein